MQSQTDEGSHPGHWVPYISCPPTLVAYGPEFASASWEPRYYDETIDLSEAKPMAFRGTRLNRLTKSVTDLLATRDQLDEDQKARFDEIWEGHMSSSQGSFRMLTISRVMSQNK
jgi:hypothetical protein